MRNLWFGFLLLICTHPSFAFEQNHQKWTTVLQTYQNNQGLIQYKKLKADTTADANHVFNIYLSDLQNVKHVDFEKWPKNEKMAFLINAYNAFTFKLIIDHYPVASIKKIGGLFTQPWSVEFFSLFDGKIKSIDLIEHVWLRPIYKDFRIHAAVNCASISCPPLRHEAFVGAKLDAQLDNQMREWLKDKTRNQISTEENVFKVSKIFDWYKSDFEKWGGGVWNVIIKYMDNPISSDMAKNIKIQYLDYNWGLNEAQ
jgi:hypothetical protein